MQLGGGKHLLILLMVERNFQKIQKLSWSFSEYENKGLFTCEKTKQKQILRKKDKKSFFLRKFYVNNGNFQKIVIVNNKCRKTINS